MSQRISSSNPSDSQIRRARSATKLGQIHFRRTVTQPIAITSFVVRAISPFNNAVPIIPWL